MATRTSTAGTSDPRDYPQGGVSGDVQKLVDATKTLWSGIKKTERLFRPFKKRKKKSTSIHPGGFSMGTMKTHREVPLPTRPGMSKEKLEKTVKFGAKNPARRGRSSW